jgi:CubicO group peptidase (beta-lactamase class C family)
MFKKKNFRNIIILLLLVALAYGIRYAWSAFPIISGYSAKNMASGIFVAGRSEGSVKNEELGSFPLSLASFTINYRDSSVTASVFGLAKHKAIYRKGLGCTLVNDLSELEIREQNFVLPAPSALSIDSIAWPNGELVAGVYPELKADSLNIALDRAFEEPIPGKRTGTRAVVVVYNGKLVAEKYAPGYDRHSRMLSWSMAKSVTSALIGILVKDGRLKAEAPAPVPEWSAPGDPRHAIALQDLLHQASGLRFEENYSKACEATNMLFRKGDMAAFTASQPLQYKPGSVFSYSSGNSNILSRIIRYSVGEKKYHSFPYDSLFYKIGMYSAVFEPDASGTYVGSSYLYATARDWARFGLLYCNRGWWNGKQILTEEWIAKTTTPYEADKLQQYGYQFWLNGFDGDKPAKRKYPDVPSDMYHADGYGGQEVFIIPSRKLVVVRLGLHVMNENKLLREILAALH